MRRDLLIGLLLAALTVGVYWPVRTHEFIFYDDPQFVLENPQIQSGLNWNTFQYAFRTTVAGNWHPVTTLSHALDCDLFGLNAGAHHMVSVFFHALNALLLFILVQEWNRRLAFRPLKNESKLGWLEGNVPLSTLGSVFIALVFSLHPLRVESVAWVSERKDLLSAFFFLLTLWFYARYTGCKLLQKDPLPEKIPATKSLRYLFYSMSLLCFALGLMSKPMLVTVPFVLLLVDFWPFRRFDTSNIRSLAADVRIALLEKAPFFFLAALDCWITIRVQNHAGAMKVIESVSWSDRITNAIASYVRYLGKLFWPTDLSIVYPHPANHYFLTDRWPFWEILLSAVFLGLVSILCLLQLKQSPYFAVGWFWFLGMLVPVIGLVQVGEQAMADRYTYLPLIGPVVALACFAMDTVRHFGFGWSSPSNLSKELNPQHEKQTASFLSSPGNFGHRYSLSAVAAAAILVLALGLSCLTRHQLAFWQNTVTLFDHAVAVTADNPSAQFALGVGLEKQDDLSQAMVHYRVAVAIDPHYAKAFYNMGQLLRKSQRWQEAANAYLSAARYSPYDVPTQLNLASVLSRLGRFNEAVTHFDEALRLDPDSIEGLNNLAWLLSTSPNSQIRNGARAVQLAQRAGALTAFRMPVVLGTLAASYAEAGRFTEAITTAQEACSLAMQTGDSLVASKNQELLKLYQKNQPYREQ